MSHYSEVKTSIKDLECLVKALITMGFKKEHVDLLSEKEQLRGYTGDSREQRADVRIKGSGWGRGQNHVGGASNDLGWEKQANGTYAMHVSDYDSHRYGKTWQDKMEAQYSSEVIKKKARQCGYHLAETYDKTSGEITLKVNVF